MEKKAVFQRAVFPLLVLLGVMIISINMYDLARRVESRTLHTVLSHGGAVLMFLSIWLGALFLNTVAFFRGAGFLERLAICLVVPVIWCLKVLSDFIGLFSLGEFLFLLFHHFILGCIVIALLCVGVSEIWCRLIAKRRAGAAGLRVFALENTVVLLIGVVLTFLMLWNGGHAYYYWYMDVYTKLFLS